MTHSYPATSYDTHIESVWIRLILLKLKTYCWNHYSKIIFKYVNSTVGPIFNEKVAKKWNLWVHEQYMIIVCCRKVNICGYCSLNSIWTVTAFCQNAWKKKKKRQNADVGGKRGSKHTLSTTKLNSKYLMSAFPTNSTNQREHLRLFLVRPMKP